MLVCPVLVTEIPRTKEGLVDFEALGLNDSIVPYRGFPLPEPAIDARGSEVCKLCRGSLSQGPVRGLSLIHI